MRRLTTLILATLAGATFAAGCGARESKPDTVPAQQAAEDQAYEAERARDTAAAEAEAHRRESARLKRECPTFGKSAAAVAATRECERIHRESETLIAKSKRSLAEGKTVEDRLKREEEAMTPAEKSRIASENKRGARAAKELGEMAEHEEVEGRRHKQEHTYPPEAQHQFLVGCAAGEHSPSICRCWLHKIEARDTLPELEALSYAITHGAAVPPSIKEDLEACGLGGG
jgi:hypothetical protein